MAEENEAAIDSGGEDVIGNLETRGIEIHEDEPNSKGNHENEIDGVTLSIV